MIKIGFEQFLLIIKHLLFQMRSLDSFANPQSAPLFSQATTLPLFFEHNLVDPARVVKSFINDPQASIRVFYYQYLKLCFQLQSVDFENYISKIEQIINNEDFKFVFYQDDDPEVFSDLQFKHLITQFFGILGEAQATVEEHLNKHPIMDTVFIYFFRAILILTGKTDSLDSYIERQDLLHFLCNYFAVEISVHDKCIKFVETDIFIYEEDPKEVFMAYMDYDKNNNQVPSQQQEDREQSLPQMVMPTEEVRSAGHNTSSRRQPTQVNTSYLSSQFVDYTQTNHPSLNGLVQPSKMRTSATIEKHEEPQTPVFMSSNIEHVKNNDSSTLPLYSDTKKAGISKADLESPQIDHGTLNYSSQSNYQSYGIGSLSDKSEHSETYAPSYEPNFHKYSGQVDDNSNQGFQKWSSGKDAIFSKSTVKQQFSAVSTLEKPPSNPGYQSSFNPNGYQPPSTGDTYRTKQSSYTSSISQNFKYTDIKPLSSQKSKEYGQVPSYQSTFSVAASEIPMPTGKNPFNLNVSLQFTNSFTMKAMANPFKENVRSIRQKARIYRDSLKSYLK